MTGDDDDAPGDRQRVVRCGPGAWPSIGAKPGPASVFDVATQPEQKAERQREIDPATAPITRRPLPDPYSGRRVSIYRTIVERMKPGDCVELTDGQGRALVQYARKAGISVTKRMLGPDLCGVWLL